MEFNWLHLSDFHQGMGEQGWLWPGMREEFYDDLGRIDQDSGPWDLILFTGDITQKGSEAEFHQFDRQLDDLKTHLAQRKPASDPIFLAVPGNHDLVRPSDKTEWLRLFRLWDKDEEFREGFWKWEEGSPSRELIEAVFKNYDAWWARHSQNLPGYQPGLLPGDFSISMEKDGARLGIVGLNTAFLQLTGGDYEGKLALHTRQFHQACGGDGAAWARRHHACLLMTHHPVSWLDSESRGHLNGEILSKQRFALHLCGHLHEAAMLEVAEAGGDPRRQLQAPSLCGLEYYGERMQRSHGYVAGKMSCSRGDTGELVFWPRKANKQGGVWHLASDNGSIHLPDDRKTNPISFKLLTSCANEDAGHKGQSQDDGTHSSSKASPLDEEIKKNIRAILKEDGIAALTPYVWEKLEQSTRLDAALLAALRELDLPELLLAPEISPEDSLSAFIVAVEKYLKDAQRDGNQKLLPNFVERMEETVGWLLLRAVDPDWLDMRLPLQQRYSGIKVRLLERYHSCIEVAVSGLMVRGARFGKKMEKSPLRGRYAINAGAESGYGPVGSMQNVLEAIWQKVERRAVPKPFCDDDLAHLRDILDADFRVDRKYHLTVALDEKATFTEDDLDQLQKTFPQLSMVLIRADGEKALLLSDTFLDRMIQNFFDAIGAKTTP